MSAKGPLYPHFADIDAFIDGLGARSFQALSNGIGIGEIREARRVIVPERVAPMASVAVTAAPMVARPAQVAAAVYAPAPTVARPAASRGTQRLLASSVDLGIVLVSTILLVLALAAVTGGSHAHGVLGLLGSGPARWVATQSMWTILFGVVGVFVFYRVVFRVLAGMTLGEFLVGSNDAKPVADMGATTRNH